MLNLQNADSTVRAIGGVAASSPNSSKTHWLHHSRRLGPGVLLTGFFSSLCSGGCYCLALIASLLRRLKNVANVITLRPVMYGRCFGRLQIILPFMAVAKGLHVRQRIQ